MKDKYESLDFAWIIGNGPAAESITRLRKLFPATPAVPPGEAWFMSEKRKFHVEFVELPVEQVPSSMIDSFPFDMTSGHALRIAEYVADVILIEGAIRD